MSPPKPLDPLALKRSKTYGQKSNVTRILLTGGPCAGKTTGLAEINSDLTQLGYKVLAVPEAATLFGNGGAMIAAKSFNAQ